MARIARFVVCMGLVYGIHGYGFAENWPQFRGPHGTGTAKDTSHAAQTAVPVVVWKREVPGAGWAQPIVWQDTVFLATAVSDPPIRPKNMMQGVADPRSMPNSKATVPDIELKWTLLAMSLESGHPRWSQVVHAGRPKFAVHPSNTYATETPTADSRGIYVYFGMAGIVAAFDHQGNQQWSVDLGTHPTQENFGTAASPVLHQGKLFVQAFNQDESRLICFDAQSGQQIWTSNRPDPGTSWCTPFLWRNGLRTELIVSGQKLLTSHDPETGAELWRIAGMDVPSTASVTGDHQALFFGYRAPFAAGPLYAIEQGGMGDLSPTAGEKNIKQLRWAQGAAAPGMPSPLALRDCVYAINGSTLSCHAVDSGTLQYRKRLPELATVAASPVAVGDRVIVVDEQGTILWLKAGPEFEVLSSLKLNDTVWASPALSGRRLLIRSVDALHCVE